MKSISVIIPNFNGVDLLRKYLPSLYMSLSTSKIDNFEVIIPDDASTDTSISFVEGNYPDIIIIRNIDNQGFSGNVNTGLNVATKDLVFILNSDVKLLDNYFSPLLKYFKNDDTFGVMGRIIAMDGDEIQDSAKYPSYSFGKIKSSKNYLVKSRNALYSFFMSGANSLIDRNKLLSLGGFNELFNPYYSEDVDLGITAWRAGYKIYYEHNSVCRHPNSATIKKQSKNKVKIIAQRNKIILHYLHLGRFEFAYYLLRYSLNSIFRILLFDLTYIKSIILFCVKFKEISIYKKQIKKHRIKTISEVTLFIKNDLRDSELDIF